MQTEGVDIETLAVQMDSVSGAEIEAICTEAGMLAIRSDRKAVTMADFENAHQKVIEDQDEMADVAPSVAFA